MFVLFETNETNAFQSTLVCWPIMQQLPVWFHVLSGWVVSVQRGLHLGGSVSMGILSRGYVQRASLPMESLSRGGSLSMRKIPTPVTRITDTCLWKHYLRLRSVKIMLFTKQGYWKKHEICTVELVMENESICVISVPDEPAQLLINDPAKIHASSLINVHGHTWKIWLNL